MILFKGKFTKHAEIWFDNHVELPKNVDIVTYRQRSQAIQGTKYQEFFTILIDLSRDADSLLAGMSKTHRYQINRAEKRDNVKYEFYKSLTPDVISEFYDFYHRFTKLKNLQPLNISILRAYNHRKALALSRVKDKSGETLCWHAYYYTSNRARFLLGASNYFDYRNSQFRNLVGRANRYQHWHDILQFKKEGITTYDLGGWYSGTDDKARLHINKFKEGFGGKKIQNFNMIKSVTLKGKLYLFFHQLLKKKY